jgi:Protein of unknown function (DUF3551)
MRALAWIILATGTMLVSAPARAQTYDPNYPVCVHVYGGEGDYIDCSYTSPAQCNASASGRSAQCEVNPFFTHPYEGRSGRRTVR